MFGFLKNFLKKQENNVPMGPSTTGYPAPGPVPVNSNPFQRNGQAAPANGVPHQQTTTSGLGRGLEIPLQSIIGSLPAELQSKVVNQDAGCLTFTAALEKVLPQLSHGAVKITFGELRHAAPQFFLADPGQDHLPVYLPLAEVLAKLNPALIRRRRVQRQIEIPPEIASPFDINGGGCRIASGKPEKVVRPSTGQNRLSQEPLSPAINVTRSTIPVSASPPAPLRPAIVPTSPPPQVPSAIPLRPVNMPPSRMAQDLASTAPAQPTNGNSAPSTPPAPLKMTVAPELGAGVANPLLVGLSVVSETWPEAVRREIVQLNLIQAKLALPMEATERGLRQGKLVFNWRTLRSWLKPAPLPSVSAQDAVMLELPLKIVAPVFLARQKTLAGGASRSRISLDEEIPNLFFGTTPPDSSLATGATSKTSDTNLYNWDDTVESLRSPEAPNHRKSEGPSAGTRFVSKYATPNELVSRAAALDGVAGALVGLPDGLLVASEVPKDLNADTIAAFLPQIYSKVSQSTKELRMGELNNLSFTVGNVPWKIFRVNAIYFAAFGRAGEPLPTAQLLSLAGELDHKPK